MCSTTKTARLPCAARPRPPASTCAIGPVIASDGSPVYGLEASTSNGVPSHAPASSDFTASPTVCRLIGRFSAGIVGEGGCAPRVEVLIVERTDSPGFLADGIGNGDFDRPGASTATRARAVRALVLPGHDPEVFVRFGSARAGAVRIAD